MKRVWRGLRGSGGNKMYILTTPPVVNRQSYTDNDTSVYSFTMVAFTGLMLSLSKWWKLLYAFKKFSLFPNMFGLCVCLL